MLNGSTFVNFDSCPNCGSRDNLSRWSDGHAWCFGCKYYEPARISSRLPQIEPVVKENKLRALPEDSTTQLGAKGWQWLNKYGIRPDETRNFRWSDSEEWLIYIIDDGAWQARCFAENAKRKYLTFGPVSDILHIVGEPFGEKIVLVEDVLSAIKVGRFVSAIPIFGSNVHLKTLVRLVQRFKHLVVWLDKDKANESVKSTHRASQLGFESTRSIISELDPKEYNDEAILEFLQ